MSATFYEKQFLLGSIGLPSDIVHEIKNFVFDDSVSGESKKAKNRAISILKTAVSRESSDSQFCFPDLVYDIGGIRVTHWAYGFVYSSETIQMQATHCMHCGNYHMFSSMLHARYSPIIFCNCPQNDMMDEEIEYEGEGETDNETTYMDIA